MPPIAFHRQLFGKGGVVGQDGQRFSEVFHLPSSSDHIDKDPKSAKQTPGSWRRLAISSLQSTAPRVLHSLTMPPISCFSWKTRLTKFTRACSFLLNLLSSCKCSSSGRWPLSAICASKARTPLGLVFQHLLHHVRVDGNHFGLGFVRARRGLVSPKSGFLA